MKNSYSLPKNMIVAIVVMFSIYQGNGQVPHQATDQSVASYTTMSDEDNPIADALKINGRLYTSANYETRGPLHDSFLILFSPDFDNALNENDAIKPMNFTENMGLGTPESAYSIERRELPVVGENLAIFFTNYNHQDYNIVFNTSDFSNATPYLVDGYTGEEILLEIGQTTFGFHVDPTVPASIASDRFHIYFGPKVVPVPPVNDDLCDAIPLSIGADCSGNVYTTANATTESGEISGDCWFVGVGATNSVWFSFVAPNSGSVEITTDFPGTLVDTELAVYEASATCTDLSGLTQIACDEDGGSGRTSLLSLQELTPNATYYIQVDGYEQSSGAFCLTVKNDGFVYENGSWAPENPIGHALPTDNVVVVNGTAHFDQNIAINTLTVKPGATLEIDHTLKVNGDINNEGHIIFKNTEAQTGELDALASSAAIRGDGEFTVQSYMSDHRSFRFVSSPVTTSSSIHANWQEGANSATDNPAPGYGTHITGTLNDQENGFDATVSGNPSLFRLNADAQAFETVENTDVNTLTAGEDYMIYVRGDRAIDLTSNASHSSTTLQATGELVYGDRTQNLGPIAGGKFIAVANPYACAVDLNSVLANSSANINANFAYVYDPNLSAGTGGYVTVNLPSGSTGASPSTANQYLQPGQAVQVKIESSGTTSLSFAESDKTPGHQTTTFGNAATSENTAHINGLLFTSENHALGNTPHDTFGLWFAEGFSNALNDKDAVKAFNFKENMGIGTPENPYSIEHRAMPVENETIALFTTNYTHQNYTLVLDVSDFDSLTPYFTDDYTGEVRTLQTGENLVNFTVDANLPESVASNRFHIHFEPSELSVDVAEKAYGIKLYPNPAQSGNAFYVTAGQFKGHSVKVTITDLLGQQVYRGQKEFRGNQIALQPNRPLDSGTYFVTLEQGDRKTVKRLMVN